jgi:hypothetical protein
MSAACGRTGLLAGSASSPAGRLPATLWRKGSGVVMVPEGLVRRWETAYREYGLASKMVNTTEPGDRAVARQMARASKDVADAWRLMASEPDMPWWVLAALGAAAQAFEYQARDWSARAKFDRESSTGGPYVRERKAPYPVTDQVAGRHSLKGGAADAV